MSSAGSNNLSSIFTLEDAHLLHPTNLGGGQDAVLKHGLDEGISVMPLALQDQVSQEALFFAVFE